MKISIASVKDVAHHDAVFLADRANGGENIRQARPRNHRVLHDQMRRQASHRSKCLLSSLPELHALRVVARDLHIPRAAIEADPPHGFEVRRNASLQSVELDE